MSKKRLLAGAAVLGLVLGSAAVAQEAGPAPQPSAQDCSGLGCLFGSRNSAPQPAARSPEAKALQDNQRAAEAAAAADAGEAKGTSSGRAQKRVASKRASAKAVAEAPMPAANQAASSKTAAAMPDAAPESQSKKFASKSVHTVTIAAAGVEAERLEQLVAALPKEKIKIVEPKANGKTKADFTVTTALEPAAGAEKAKLFTEQLHIVASDKIKSVADLQGKVVSFGPDKSQGQIAARKAFEALHVKVDETPLEIDNALDGLSTGDVSAVVVLAPQPIDKLKTVSASGAHLVSWPEGGSLPDGAASVTIDPAAYPSLAKPGEKILAVGVDAKLVLSPRGAKLNAAKSFLKSLSQNADDLSKHGFDLLKADLDTRNGRRLASAR